MLYLQYILWFIFIVIFLLFIIVFLLWLINSIIYKVPQVSTFQSDFNVLKKFLVKYKPSWKKIVDLGSWTWKTIRFFEKEFNMNTFWYEIDFWNFLISVFLNKLFWLNSTIFRNNYLKADISNYDFIYIYLFTELMKGIESRIWNSAKKWTIIISNAFKLLDHKPIEVLYDDKWKEEIYIYKV